MDWLLTTLTIYKRVFGRGSVLMVRNWPMAATVFAYVGVMLVAGVVTRMVGLLGGIVAYLAVAVCAGSFLYCVEAIVRTGKATLADVRSSIGAYFSDVVGVMFALWIFSLVGALLASSPMGPALIVFSGVLIFVFFNAVPELIYLGRHSTMDLLRESYRFILHNWIEWLPVTIAFALVLPALWNLPSGGVAFTFLRYLAYGFALYFAMVVRGLLFLELAESSRRSRIFRHRAGGL